jgi:DNA polymerase II small subunit
MSEEIIIKFFSKGRLLTPDALDFIKNNQSEIFFGYNFNNLIISEKELKNILKTEQYKIIKNLTSIPTEIGVEDFTKFYKSKYEKMRDIITERINKDFISLNKIDNSRKEIYVVGIIKDLTEKDGKKIIDLEDLTTTIPVVFNSIGDLELDDVVAIRAVAAGKILFGKEIIYPDIPLRNPVRGFGEGCFISDLHLNETPKADIEKFFLWFEKQNIENLFVAGDVVDHDYLEKLVEQYCSDGNVFVIQGNTDQDGYPQLPYPYKNKNITSLSNPGMIEVGGLKILMIHNASMIMMKKRYLGRSSRVLPEDYLVLDIIPDIVHHGHTHEPQITNYKSTTFVNSGSLLSNFMPVIIDFETREARHVNIQEGF